MLQDTKTYLLFGNQYCGIEHNSQNGATNLFATLLKKKKKEVDIDKSVDANTIAELANHLPKNIGAFLVINDKNVITKRIESEHQNPLKLVQAAFPNLNLNEFVYEVLLQKTVHFVSICRRNYIEQLIDDYKKHKISILNVSLGSLMVSNLIDFLSSTEIYTSNAKVSTEAQVLIAVEGVESTTKESYGINGLTISNEKILSFSAALSLLLDTNKTYSSFANGKEALQTDYNQTRFFKQFLKFGLIFLFCLLLINFMFFNHYFNNVSVLEQSSQVNQSTKVKVKELTEKVKKSQETVDIMLNSTASKSSYYMNAIVNSMPNTILLSEINYQPLLKRIKANEPIQYNSNVILISGDTNDSALFSNWINDLEALSWIQSIDIIDYSDVSNALSTFRIKLNFGDD